MSEQIPTWQHELWLLPAGERKPETYTLPIYDFCLMLMEGFKQRIPSTRVWVESTRITPEGGKQ